jgi:hypothetical protein
MTRGILSGTCVCGIENRVEIVHIQKEIPKSIAYRCQSCGVASTLTLMETRLLTPMEVGGVPVKETRQKGTPHRFANRGRRKFVDDLDATIDHDSGGGRQRPHVSGDGGSVDEAEISVHRARAAQRAQEIGSTFNGGSTTSKLARNPDWRPRDAHSRGALEERMLRMRQAKKHNTEGNPRRKSTPEETSAARKRGRAQQQNIVKPYERAALTTGQDT